MFILTFLNGQNEVDWDAFNAAVQADDGTRHAP